MLNNKKHVFWQALFLTLLFFFFGLVFGVYIEQARSDTLNSAFYESEVSLYDSFALGRFIEAKNVSCEDLNEAGVRFADKIYTEARELEKFDASNKLTQSVKIIHKKYDLLRTLLWMNLMEVERNCEEINVIVYLYLYDSEDLTIKSKQIAWSRVLQDLKETKGSDLILIPIAVDQNLVSLDSLIKTFEVREFPAVIINEKQVIYEIKSSDEIEKYLN